jgi:hypothetical protein
VVGRQFIAPLVELCVPRKSPPVIILMAFDVFEGNIPEACDNPFFGGLGGWVWTWRADDGSWSKIRKTKSVGTSVGNPIGWQQVLLSHVQSDLPSLDFDLIAERPTLNE